MLSYTSKEGETFTMDNPELTSFLYFPLANEQGVMSAITPNLSGDLKLSQNTFFMPPVSSENLHNDKSSRNFWVQVNGTWWSATGKSSSAQSMLFDQDKEHTSLEAGFMHHSLTRTSAMGLKAKLITFVPYTKEEVEVTGLTLTNETSEHMTLRVLSAIPIYGRSADNIRDHRHVTALLNRIETTPLGVVVTPTMTFDERGHQVNQLSYGVFGGNDKESPQGFFPRIDTFIGEGGSLEHPRALFGQGLSPVEVGTNLEGYEALGGLLFQEQTLAPSESLFYAFVLGFSEDPKALADTAKKYLQQSHFEKILKETKDYWQRKVNVSYETGHDAFNHWMKWVSFQPLLRRIYGCSFLPHHDYGKGGRGWRDLWQDCLALLLMDPEGVKEMLLNNFSGIRLDGTNATIIGHGPGEFIADRNNITRVWMDHAMWPFLTTNLYIQQTGDLDLLLAETTYFEDPQILRGEEKNPSWDPKKENLLRDAAGNPYQGTILEHILVEHLTAYYDVGEQGHMRLRGADWNDALDLAREKGESVAFTAMYASNMENLAALLTTLKDRGLETVSLQKNLLPMFLTEERGVLSPLEKQARLREYCLAPFTGEKESVSLDRVIQSLQSMANALKTRIQEKEWVTLPSGEGFYNGYYDNHSKRVEGQFPQGVRMMLTSQVFTLMSHTAREEEVTKIIRAADAHLYDASVGGYKLNTNFHEVKMDLGRMFGFGYGHKENGAVFAHMAVMYAYALYTRKRAKEAYKVINTLHEHCANFSVSKIFPGIPEYIDAEGRGMYHYLTGSASWMLLTVITQMFGVRGELGHLSFRPQLLPEQFDEQGAASLHLPYHGRSLKVTYENPQRLSPEDYEVQEIFLNGTSCTMEKGAAVLKKEQLLDLDPKTPHKILVVLGQRRSS